MILQLLSPTQGVDTDVTGALAALAFGQGIQSLDLAPPIKAKLLSGHPLHACRAIISTFEKVTEGLKSVESFVESLQHYGDFNLATWAGLKPEEDLLGFAKNLKGKLEDAIRGMNLLIPWSLYVARRKDAKELGLDEFVTLIESKRVPASELADVYAYCTYAMIVREAFRQIPQLNKTTPKGKWHRRGRSAKSMVTEILSLSV